MVATLVACSGGRQAAQTHPAVAIGPHDRDAVDGMTIVHYPGPKGEVYMSGSTKPLEFCATSSLMIYVLEREHRASVQDIYVQDMGSRDWRKRWYQMNTRPFVDGRTAWYVVDQRLPGAMGPTLATFRDLKDATAFSRRYGGNVLAFKGLTRGVMTHLKPVPLPTARERE